MTSLKRNVVYITKYTGRHYQQSEKKGKVWGTFVYYDRNGGLWRTFERSETTNDVQDFIDKIMAGDGPSLAKLATAWFLFFTVKYHIDLRRIGKWPSTIGDLKRFRLIRGVASIEPMKMIEYHYEIDGETYTGGATNLAHIRIGGNSSGRCIKKMMDRVERIDEDKVILHYDPKKPWKSLLLKPSLIEYRFLTALYVATFGVAYLGFIYAG